MELGQGYLVSRIFSHFQSEQRTYPKSKQRTFSKSQSEERIYFRARLL